MAIMKISRSNLTLIMFFIYLLSLNGRVKNIKRNIKESMIITVSGKDPFTGLSLPQGDLNHYENEGLCPAKYP